MARGTIPVLNCICCIWNVDLSPKQAETVTEACVYCSCEVCSLEWLQHSTVSLRTLNLLTEWTLVAWRIAGLLGGVTPPVRTTNRECLSDSSLYLTASGNANIIFFILFAVAKKPSSVLSFFRGTGGKSPDLSSQKKETLRGADSAYYQVGQMGKEGAENQGAEPQGTGLLLLNPSSVLKC